MAAYGRAIAALSLFALVGCAAPSRPAPPTEEPVPPVAAPTPTSARVGQPAPSPAPSPTAAGASPSLPIAGQPGPGGGSAPDALIARVISDAAGRTGVAPDAVRVVRVEARDWPNSGLGCPQPGMGYAQVITPGFLIVVEAAGRTLEYHTDRSRAELCSR